MKHLCDQNLKDSKIKKFNYNRENAIVGVLHFGPGAFHRAHQAFYFDKLLETNNEFAICEIGLNTNRFGEKLKNQDFLYSLAIFDKEIEYKTIGSIKEFLWARTDKTEILNKIASPNTKILSSTITEKAYFEPNKFDPLCPKTYVEFLAMGLNERRKANIAPPLVLVCDNLNKNGETLKNLMLDFASQYLPDAYDYISATHFPNSMVDSITPATDEALKNVVYDASGLYDEWPIKREKFVQWVIEKNEYSKILESVGVISTENLRQYELAKLRILNGAHSCIAYLGLLMGYEYVADAIKDAKIKKLIESAIFDEIIPYLDADFDLEDYANQVIERFENPNIFHKLSQIAWDGSQKLPIRIMGTIHDCFQRGKIPKSLIFGVAAWFVFLWQNCRKNNEIIDPCAGQFIEAFKKNAECKDFAMALIKENNILGSLVPNAPEFTSILIDKINWLVSAGEV